MLIHPKDAQSILTEPDDKQIQPNTIDLRLDRVFKILHNQPFHLSEQTKDVRYVEEVFVNASGVFDLDGQSVYELRSSTYIKMAEGEAGIVLGRSTFNRNGILIISSVYDSGFEDYIGATLYNIGGPVTLTRGSRFAHLVMMEAETFAMYNGSYGNHNNPQTKSKSCVNTTGTAFQ